MPLEVCAPIARKDGIAGIRSANSWKRTDESAEHVRCGQARNRVIGHKRRQRETRPL